MQYVRFIALCFLEDKFRFCVEVNAIGKTVRGIMGAFQDVMRSDLMKRVVQLVRKSGRI